MTREITGGKAVSLHYFRILFEMHRFAQLGTTCPNFSSVQSLSHVWLFVTPWTAARQASLSITNFQSLLKLMSMELVMWSNHLILCHPLLLLLSFFPSIKVFSNESVDQSIEASASASAFPMNIQDWLPLALTGLVSLLSKGLSRIFSRHHSVKVSIPHCSAFFIVQFSHPYMTAGKTIALTIQTFVGKVMSLLFNMLSRFVIIFLLRSNHLLILWLQSLFAVILEPKKIKSIIVSTVFPIYLPWSDRTRCHDLGYLNIEF